MESNGLKKDHFVIKLRLSITIRKKLRKKELFTMTGPPLTDVTLVATKLFEMNF